MKKKNVITIVLLAVVFLSINIMGALQVGAEDLIVVGTGGNYNPWCFQKNGKLQGFEIDVWNEISKRTGYKVEFKIAEFSGLMGMLDTNKVDTVAHQMSITPEREEKYVFTTPYAYSKYDFIVKKNSSYQSMEDLKNKKVGAWLGGNGQRTLEQLDEKKQLKLNKKYYDGAPLEKLVESGRIDACWQSAVKSKSVIEKENMDLRLMGVNTPIGTEINAYAFTKDSDNKDKITEINKVIKAMHEDGTLSSLSIKWFDIETTTK